VFLKCLLNGVQITTTPTVSYIHTDHLAGSNALTNDQGELVQLLDYFPYGKARIDSYLGTFNERRKFIGQEYDEGIQLSYLQARYYSGSRGLFLSQDPVFWEIGQTRDGKAALLDPQLQNSYSYARNNPIINKDPEGRFIPQAIALGALYGGITGFAGQVYADYQAGSVSSIGIYSYAAFSGAVTGAGTVVNPFIGAGLATSFSLGRSFAENGGYITAETGVQALAEGTVTGLTAGFLKGLPKIRGPQASKIFGGRYFGGAHGVRYVSEAVFGLGTDIYLKNIQQFTNSTISSASMKSGAAGGSINQLSQAVVGYASTPGANLSDSRFISALRAINEYNNSLVTSKR